MPILYIENSVNYHYEIIESIIINCNKIINKLSSNNTLQIYLGIIIDRAFIAYIHNKYPNILFGRPNNYDYYINCTIYNRDLHRIDTNANNKFYIAHEITPELLSYSNVYFLTPLSKQNYIMVDTMPFNNYKKLSNIPIYIIQGNITSTRRNYNLLIRLLEHKTEYDFKFKLVGRGVLPECLQKYSDKIILKNNLDFIDYHKEFLDGYCILPLISKKSHPQYYTNKLTSTINYATGYKLKCLIDIDLQNIYNLENVEIFNDEHDIVDAFNKTLSEFYASK